MGSLEGSFFWFDSSSKSMKECRYTTNNAKNSGSTVNGVDDDGFLSFDVQLTLDQLIEAIKNMPSSYSDDELGGLVDAASGPMEEEDAEENCRNANGAESLGWIVCPMLTWMGNAAKDLYVSFVEPNLQIEPTLFNNEYSGDATRVAWESFRDIANVLFIVLFLIVIFSQLTGIGIDNYGIKKILPRLIVAAIMINLSYIICLILVDISNILGSGLKSVFDSLSSQLPTTSITLTESNSSFSGVGTSYDLGGVLAGVGIATALVLVIGSIWANPAILLSLLVGVLGVIVAIFFLFILLGARKALVVILTVISPLAVVVYMLPNTKKMFERWWKLFEGLLLVYPIAGMLVGAGDYASKLLLQNSDGEFFTWIIAMIVGIVPIFFIPMVLKGSFSAMGKVGGMLTGLGARASNATKHQVKARGGEIANKVGKTDAYRMARNAIGMHSLTKRGRARAVRDTAALTKERSERARLADRKNMETRIASINAAEEAKATDEATAQRLSLMQSTGGEGGIRMNDGTRAAFTLSNAEARMSELEHKSRNSELTDAEKLEVGALARGMANMKGGGGALGKIVRNAGVTEERDNDGNVISRTSKLNKSFMSAMGDVYARDSLVQSKMNEKDMGASIFTEQFMPGGSGLSKDAENQTNFGSGFSGYQKNAEYKDALSRRIKTHEAGLNQGGEAVDEYISGRDATQMQNIMNDERLLNSLDVETRNKVEKRAGELNVSKTPQQVEVMNSGMNVGGGAAAGDNRGGGTGPASNVDSNATYASFVRRPTVHEFYNAKGNSMMLEELGDGRLADEDGNTSYKRENWSRTDPTKKQ